MRKHGGGLIYDAAGKYMERLQDAEKEGPLAVGSDGAGANHWLALWARDEADSAVCTATPPAVQLPQPSDSTGMVKHRPSKRLLRLLRSRQNASFDSSEHSPSDH